MDTFVTPMLEHLHFSTRVSCIFSSRAATSNNVEKATTFRNISMGDFMKLGEMIKKNRKKWQTTGCLVNPLDFNGCGAHDLFFYGAGDYLQM